MGKKATALTLILAFLVSLLAGTLLIQKGAKICRCLSDSGGSDGSWFANLLQKAYESKIRGFL